ncbi:AraC family transcriptional regulator [Rathayibacter caricis DSM 15933]|uniref:AraC family transcriptional regulator n=1 Tax=Rathayibacter caricis DSM 15933 TaxID=1328867 RepID=A0A2T4UXM6_9MICO|nr:AraC family transcriptional regulator [Rathayibacter caricis]PTL74271.1 AraC family transcriptional regulator [Rathayibacter caricis DSM 15933]
MSAALPAVSGFEHASRRVDEAIAFYSDGYHGTRFRAEPLPDSFFFRYTALGDERVSIRTSTFRGSIRGEIAPQGEYVVSWLQAGRGVMDVGRDETPLLRARPAVFPTGRPFEFDFGEYDQRLVHVDGGFLEGVAAESTGADPAPLVFDHRAVPRPADVDAWWDAVRDLSGLLASRASALQLAEADRGVALRLLAAFPHRPVAVPADVLRPSNAHLLRAAEFVHAFASSPISLSDIATAAALTPRALQLAFRRHFGRTPLGYLRDVRLDRARDELRHADPDTTTIAAVSARWGFLNPGRFAGAYLQRFGEYPLETLRGGR